MPAKDLAWTRDEVVLVHLLYLNHVYPEKGSPSPDALARVSRELQALTIHPPDDRLPNFRSTSAVQMMLDKLADAARKTTRARGESALAEEVWNEFGSDTRRVLEEDRRIKGLPPLASARTGDEAA